MGARVTVLMAVRNGGTALSAALESILRQTYRDFTFLIIDDASTDDTRQMLRAAGDPRIDLVTSERQRGQTAALNLGLRRATTPWIARMDADDYAAPTRLEEQMQALAAEGSLGCVGTGAWEFRDDPRVVETVVLRPERHEEIARALLLGAAMIHGTIVVSREAMLEVGAYDERFRYAADRDLFVRLFARCRGRNLQQPLLGIRRAPDQDSYSEVAANEYIEIFRQMLASDRYSDEEVAVLRGSLSYAHIFRARCRKALGRYAGSMQDVAQAFQLSPAQTMKGVARALMPPRLTRPGPR